MKAKRWAGAGLILWALAVGFITLNRHDPLSGNVPQVARPVSDVTGVPEPDVISFFYSLEWPMNVLMFLPLGVLLPLAFGWGLRRVAGVSLLCTLLIEATQGLVFGTRDASVWDVLANFLGGVIGFALVSAVAGEYRLDRAQNQVDV